jgi:hypothetical protein
MLFVGMCERPRLDGLSGPLLDNSPKYSLQTGFVLRLNSKRKAQGAHPDNGTLHRGFPELLPLILTEASDTVELDHRVTE